MESRADGMHAAPRPSPTLADLRTEIEGIDRSITLLMAERVRVAREAIAVRRRGGEPVRSPAQERRVLARARRWAEELGLPNGLVAKLMQGLIAEGKKVGPLRPSSKLVTVFLGQPELISDLPATSGLSGRIAVDREPIPVSPV